MSFNRLYQFITNDKPKFISNKKLTFKQSAQDGARFIIYTPSQPNKTSISSTINSYHLDADHLSFYELIDPKNPCLSEYHYTAYLIDNEKSKYQLHVYFNEKDQLTIDPVLTKIDENDQQITQTISTEIIDQFTTLAQTRSVEVIRKLRAELAKKINTLQTDYKEAETKLCELSTDLNKNRNAYLTQLDVTAGKLINLINYSDNSFYLSTLKSLNKIKQLLLIPQDKPLNVSDEILPEKEKPAHYDAPNISTKSNIATSKESIKPLIEKIKQLKIKLNKLDENTHAKTALKIKIETFSNYYTEINYALLLIDDEGYLSERRDTELLRASIIEATRQGEELLKRALHANDYEAAEIIKNFTPLLSENFIKNAVINNNDKLLNFLLTHSVIAINTLVIKDDLSPVQFCFENSSAKSNKKKAFDVLIKHGASIMVPAKDGLPIAHHILSNAPTHSLYTSLAPFNNQARFWCNLAASLTNYLSDHPNMPEAERAKLNQHIATYTRASRQVTGDQSRANMSSTGRILEGISDLGANYTTTQIDTIRSDSELQEKRRILEDLVTEFNKLCTPAELRANNRKGQSAISHLDEMLKKFDFSEMDSDTLKQQSLDYTNNRIEYFTLAIQLKKLQKKRTHTSQKSLRKWENEQQRLVKNMQELDAPYAIMNPDSKLSSAINGLTEFLSDFETTSNDNPAAQLGYQLGRTLGHALFEQTQNDDSDTEDEEKEAKISCAQQ